jgi:hypothetical protein
MIRVEFKNGYPTVMGSINTVKLCLEKCSLSATTANVHLQALSVLTYMDTNNSLRDFKSKNYKIIIL